MRDPAEPKPERPLVPETLATVTPQPTDPFATRSAAQEECLPGQGEESVAADLCLSPSPALPARLGRYVLRKLLGKGGMGSVYLAYDTQLDRLVALKIPRFSPHPQPEDQERFLREARAAAALSHPNICPVYDAGKIGGVSYLTMAYVEGRPLSVVLEEKDSFPAPDSLLLIRRVALGMAEAHARGVIHRDLKPSNIMIDPRGQPVVMDFGLARRGPESGDVRLTQSGVVVGTPAYMSPEQVKGLVEAMGPPCDIYSLGVILYELLAGRLPFLGTVGELMAQIVSAAPPRPSQFRPDLDRHLEAVCMRALAKEPDDRFSSMQDFADALEAVQRSPAGVSDSREESDARANSSPPGHEDGPGLSMRGHELSRLCLAARYFLEKRTEESNRKSIATYYQVLDRDPAFAPAWAGLAFAYHLLGVRGHASPASASPKGKSAALQALELDSSLAEAHTALAVILLDYEWDLAGAERAFCRALELNPGHAIAHQLYGKCLACMGRHPEAIASIRRAQELHPLSTIISATLGRHGYFYARMYDQAVREFRRTIETDPGFWIAHYFLGWAYVFQGKSDDALASFKAAALLDDNPETLAGLGYAQAASALPEKAMEALEALTELGKRHHVAPINHAVVYIGLGDAEQAFCWLDRAAEERSEWLCKIRVDPVFDPLRSHPRFSGLLQRVGGKAES